MRNVLWIVAAAALSLPAAAQTVVLRQSSNSPPGSVYHQSWLDFKARLEKGSAGAIKVELNTNEPNEANLLSNLRRGRTDCSGVSLQGAATVVPEVAVLQLPYLFSTFKEVDHVYGQPALAERFRRLFADKGLYMLSWVEVGFTHLYGVTPIRTPADVAGQKMRATQSRASQNFVRAIGAEAVVLPIAELLPGLQTGLIKGGEAGGIVYDALIGKSAPHYTLTAHAFDSGVVLCNKAWFDGLTAAQRQQVTAAYDSAKLVRDVRAQVEKIIDGAAAKGITVHRPTAAELAAWRAAGEKSAAAVMATLPADAATLRDELVAAIQRTPRSP
jgi:TRAP-type C4-dicarboxylate transport system substrate-binding protein